MLALDKVLTTLMQENDANATTVGDYLKELLFTLWVEGEGFSGKRPFGNSGWEYELYTALVVGSWIEGELDEDGYLLSCDSSAGDDLIRACIDYVFEDYLEEDK